MSITVIAMRPCVPLTAALLSSCTFWYPSVSTGAPMMNKSRGDHNEPYSVIPE